MRKESPRDMSISSNRPLSHSEVKNQINQKIPVSFRYLTNIESISQVDKPELIRQSMKG